MRGWGKLVVTFESPAALDDALDRWKESQDWGLSSGEMISDDCREAEARARDWVDGDELRVEIDLNTRTARVLPAGGR